jgi:hypothetical protein
MPTPCRRSGKRMGSAHILDLCSFPSLGSIQIHRIELSCCLPFFQHLLFESKLWVHTVVHCYTLSFTICCMFCINLLSLYDSSLSDNMCSFSLTSFHVFYFGITSSFRHSTSNMEGWGCKIPVILSRVRWRLRKESIAVAYLCHLAACCRRKAPGGCLLIRL